MNDLHVGLHGTYSDEESITIHFHQFSDIEKQGAGQVQSPTFICHGMKWRLKISARGDKSEGRHSESPVSPRRATRYTGFSNPPSSLNAGGQAQGGFSFGGQSYSPARRVSEGSVTNGWPSSSTNLGNGGSYTFGGQSSDRSRSSEDATSNESIAVHVVCEDAQGRDAPSIITKLSVRIPRMSIHKASSPKTFTREHPKWGWSEFASRRSVIDRGCLEDTLTVTVGLRVLQTKPKNWTPTNTLLKDLLAALNNQEMADIAFLVGEGDAQEEICANSTILLLRVPSMKHLVDVAKGSGHDDEDRASNDISGDGGGDDANMHNANVNGNSGAEGGAIAASGTSTSMNAPSTTSNGSSNGSSNGKDPATPLAGSPRTHDGRYVIPLPDVRPCHFHALLRFVYVEDTSFLNTNTDLQELLVVANRIGCWQLKLTIEAKMVEEHLNFDTCIDLLLLADSHSCAMLKEATLQCIATHASSFLRHHDFHKLFGCDRLMKEIHQYILTGRSLDDIDDHYSSIRVGGLYELLEEAGVALDCDCSRRILLQKVRASRGGQNRDN